jgi:predicted phage terminase large subunit-like protein
VSLGISESFVGPHDLAFLDQLADGADRLGSLRERPTWPTPGALHAAIAPHVVETPALELVDRELVALIESDAFDRLAVFMSPQEGKSERVSHAFALWLLVHNPELRIAIVSYSDEMARRHGAAIKQDAQTFDGTDGELDLGIRLREDSRAAGRWQIEGHAGGVYCVGISGSLTGKPVDVLIIDDPLKDLEQAQSEAYRKRAMNFWRGVAVPRLGPGAKVVLVQTRWDERDMGGQLLAEEPERWRKVSIPAIAEASNDPLGRQVGEPMISARGDRDWAGIRRSVGEYVWAALYQQRPAPAEGGLFTGRSSIQCGGRTVPLDSLWMFMTADLAASTKTSADYTVAAVWGMPPDGDLILLDGLREHLDPSMHWAKINALRMKWNAGTVHVEPASFGTTMVWEASRDGVPIEELKPDRDKFSRALPAAARVDAGRIWLPAVTVYGWVQDWIDELASFPHGANDDVPDNFGYAARVAAVKFLAPVDDHLAEARRLRSIDAGRTGEIDLATAVW